MSDEQITDLQKRVKELESVASDYRLNIARSEQLRRERRYALLQAAAVIFTKSAVPCPQTDPDYREAIYGECVDEAEALLAEIEKREKAEGQS